MSSVVRPRSITPPTSNTTVRGPFASTAVLNEPGPAALRLVTRMIAPPRPPGVSAAQPTAPGNASACAAVAAKAPASAAMINRIRFTMPLPAPVLTVAARRVISVYDTGYLAVQPEKKSRPQRAADDRGE